MFMCILLSLPDDVAMLLIKACLLGFFAVSACVFSLRSFTLCHRMFVISYSPLHLLDLVASHCRLSYHGYVREVGGDGSVLGGVELEIAVVQEGPAPTRFFFWSSVSFGSQSPFEESALQAIRFLQRLYGFVIRDFNYEGMQAHRDLARSAVVLAVSVLRSGSVVSPVGDVGCVDPLTESLCRQLICNQLISSVCNMYHSLVRKLFI
jgi:hypothetical protein